MAAKKDDDKEPKLSAKEQAEADKAHADEVMADAAEQAPDYAPSGRSSEEAAAQAGYHGGLVTGDPKPPEHPDPTMPREVTNPAGAPLMPHPGVSMPENVAPPVSTEEQLDEFSPQDRDAAEADREAGSDDDKDDKDTKPARRKKAPDHAENANDIELGQVINGPRR